MVVACGAVVAEEDATMTSSISSASAASMIYPLSWVNLEGKRVAFIGSTSSSASD